MIRAMAIAGTAVWFCALATNRATGGSGPQDNGNTLALDYSTASNGKKRQINKDAVGKIYFFRYLRIVGVEKGERDGQPFVNLQTVEPSSDMQVVFTVDKAVSLEKVESIEKDEAVAVTGRVKSIGEETNRIVLASAIIRYKDRLQPKTGKELLPEVDPSARIGTDTSSGQEVIKRGKR